MKANPHPGDAPQPARSTPRLVDATLTEALRNPGGPLGTDSIQSLCRVLPIPRTAAAAPLFPEGAYAWDLLIPAAHRSVMLEPLTPDAHAHAVRHLQEHAKRHPQGPAPVPLPLPGRPGAIQRVLVDPIGIPLHEADARPDEPSPGLPEGWTRERVVTLPRPPQDEAESGTLPTRTGDPTMFAKITLLAARLPRGQRLRLRDPHGAITPELATRITGLVDAPRITLHLENPDGLGPATARAALAGQRGPLVRTSLLGIGPRTGLPPTELFRPPTHPDTPEQALSDAIRALQDHAHIPVPSNHPYWGAHRHATVEPEHLGDPHAEPRTNPATIGAILDHHLTEWGLELTPQEHARVLARLLAHVRPGEALTGPVLWALVAQETDLEERVR